MSGSVYQRNSDGLILHIRAQPNAASDTLDGVHEAADGRLSLKVRVRAQPENGKANKAVAAVLAKAAGIAKSRVSLVAGAGSRRKSFMLKGDAAEIINRLRPVLDRPETQRTGED